MSLFRRGKEETPEHAVLLHYALSNDEYGTNQEREDVFKLEERLEEAIAGAGAGELDGNEFGGGEAVLYMYGPSTDALWSAVEPVARDFPLRPAYALLGAGGPEVEPTRIEL